MTAPQHHPDPRRARCARGTAWRPLPPAIRARRGAWIPLALAIVAPFWLAFFLLIG